MSPSTFYLRKKNRPVACVTFAEKGDVIYYGISLCNKKDHLSKRVGRSIALERLSAALERGHFNGKFNGFVSTLDVPPTRLDRYKAVLDAITKRPQESTIGEVQRMARTYLKNQQVSPVE